MIAWESASDTLTISSSWFKNEAVQIEYNEKGEAKKCMWTKDVLLRGWSPLRLSTLCKDAQFIQANWFQRFNGGPAVRVGTRAQTAIVIGNISEDHTFPKSQWWLERLLASFGLLPVLVVHDNITL